MALPYVSVHVRVDDEVIAAGDPWKVIEPVWWTATVYDGPDEYELSLLQFSLSQRLVFAVLWYRAEVENGGHHQFYSNSTGIVWKDALDALTAMDASELVAILRESADLLGGFPSLNRDERDEQLTLFNPDFKELDARFYAAESRLDLDKTMIGFICAHPSDFYFDGMIRARSLAAEFGRQRMNWHGTSAGSSHRTKFQAAAHRRGSLFFDAFAIPTVRSF